MTILITGSAGFIGYHVSKKLLNKNYKIIGLDNINNYYDINLKKKRLINLKKNKKFFFNKIDLCNYVKLNNLIKKNKIKIIIHLAAQAGVRNSIKNPKNYFKSNLEGFFNILEVSRNNRIKHLIFASTSSVYGENNKFPLNENDKTDHPLSFYAATKKSNEVMAHSYSHIYKLPCTGVRFFTVYGPFGRPDMMYFKFTKNIIENKKIQIFGNGEMWRYFTYIDDIIDGIVRLSRINDNKIFNSNNVPFNIFNIGNNKPEKLNKFVKILEKTLNKKSIKVYLEMQPGDVKKTSADITKIQTLTGFRPTTNLTVGIGQFIKWYQDFYK